VIVNVTAQLRFGNCGTERARLNNHVELVCGESHFIAVALGEFAAVATVSDCEAMKRRRAEERRGGYVPSRKPVDERAVENEFGCSGNQIY
jgi:hypothetical protein